MQNCLTLKTVFGQKEVLKRITSSKDFVFGSFFVKLLYFMQIISSMNLFQKERCYHPLDIAHCFCRKFVSLSSDRQAGGQSLCPSRPRHGRECHKDSDIICTQKICFTILFSLKIKNNLLPNYLII